MKMRWVGSWDRRSRLLRLFRAVGTRGTVGDGSGYSWKLSVALRPALAELRREYESWLVTCLGIRLHFRRSYGGIFPA